MVPTSTRLPKIRQYLLSVFLVAIAAALRWVMGFLFGAAGPFVTFYPAVIVVVLLGHFGPALLAVALSTLTVAYFFMKPENSFALQAPGDIATLTIFCFSGVLLVIIAHRLYSARAERERLQSEARFRKLYDANMLGVSFYNANGTITDGNQKFLEMSGYTREDMQAGKLNWLEMTPPEYMGLEEHDASGALKTGTGIPHEKEYIRKDGSRIPIIIGPVALEEGKDGGIAFVLNISDRKQAEERIRRLNENLEERNAEVSAERARWQGVVEGIADEVWVCDLRGEMSLINLHGVMPIGLSAFKDKTVEEILREVEILNPDRQPRPTDQSPLLRSLRGEVVRGEEIMRHYETGIARWRQFSSAPTRDARGAITGAVAIIRDITEQKQMEDELRTIRDGLELRVKERTAELSRQAHLLELTHDAIVVRDMEGRITFWNRGAEDMYGWKRADALGKVMFDLLQTKYPSGLDAGEAMRCPEGWWEGEVVQTARDGSRITVMSRCATQTENGVQLGVLEINTNITEQKKVEQQLRQSQKMEALGTLAGGIAHDFNNILAAIIGFTELAEDHLPEASPERAHLKRVLKAGTRGRDLVRQMLTFSRRTDEEKKPLLLSSIVKETAGLLRASIPSTISFGVDVKSESGMVLGDPVQMQQVIMNLCTNAAQAMSEKGGILNVELSDFTVAPSEKNPLGIEPGSYVRLLVRDTGPGIAPEIIDKIFDPFFTTKKQGQGNGLGLSVVMGIVKQSQGYITVESEEGRGTTFTVYLPNVGEGPALETPAAGEAIPTGQERILFVDDEELLVEMGEQVLAELGYSVVCRTNSKAALALFRLNPSMFDLVITDQTMPDMTGIELARGMLTIRPDMPIILATGFSNLVDADSARAAGIKGFVMKPLTKREIAKTVRKVLDANKSA